VYGRGTWPTLTGCPQLSAPEFIELEGVAQPRNSIWIRKPTGATLEI
jgi:hypothetical protein